MSILKKRNKKVSEMYKRLSKFMYQIELSNIERGIGQKLTVGFVQGVTATNGELVKFVNNRMYELADNNRMGGLILIITGAASLPITFTISKHVNNLYSVIAIWDPKINAYVVTNSKEKTIEVGSSFTEEDFLGTDVKDEE